MKTKLRTLVQVPPDLVAEIDQLVGPRKRSAFLVELARKELRRQRLLKAFESPDPIWKDEDHPELEEDSDSWVRMQRLEAEGRLERTQREQD